MESVLKKKKKERFVKKEGFNPGMKE